MRVRLRDAEFDAVQWKGDALVLTRLGFFETPVGREGDNLLLGGPGNKIVVHPGDWVLRDKDGYLSGCTDEDFRGAEVVDESRSDG